MSKIRVVIVDDHAIVRDGVKALLETSDEIELLGEASNGKEALEKVAELSPDVLLCDITMPEMNGIETAAHVAENHPNTKVVMFSMHEDEEYITKSLENKASGFISKDADREEIIEALKAVQEGKNYYSDTISQKMLSTFTQNAQEQQPNPADHNVHLTSREKEILTLVATGSSSKEIGEKLFISVRTVETHRNNIMHKLEVKNSAELIKYAIGNGLIEV
jgi:DNA-binding NarL/FixJ family response regulator